MLSKNLNVLFKKKTYPINQDFIFIHINHLHLNKNNTIIVLMIIFKLDQLPLTSKRKLNVYLDKLVEYILININHNLETIPNKPLEV